MNKYLEKIKNAKSMDELLKILDELSLAFAEKGITSDESLTLGVNIITYLYNKKHDNVIEDIAMMRKEKLEKKYAELSGISEVLNDFIKVNNFSLDANDDVEKIREKINELISIHNKYGLKLEREKILMSVTSVDARKYFNIFFDKKKTDDDVIKFILNEVGDYGEFVASLNSTLNGVKAKRKDFGDILRPAEEYFKGDISSNNDLFALSVVQYGMISVNKELKDISDGKYDSLELNSYFGNEELERDIKVENFIKVLVGDKYEKMSDYEKDEIYADIKKIAEEIVNYRVFEVLMMEYLSYNAQDLSFDFDETKSRRRYTIMGRLYGYNSQLDTMKSERKMFSFVKSKEMKNLIAQIKKENEELAPINADYDRYTQVKEIYDAFYQDMGKLIFEVDRLRKKNNASYLLSEEDLDGKSEFKILPIHMSLINSNEVLAKHNIELTEDKYPEVFMACVRLLGDDKLISKIESEPRISTKISSKDLIDIMNGNYDFLMDTITKEEIYTRTKKKNNV